MNICKMACRAAWLASMAVLLSTSSGCAAVSTWFSGLAHCIDAKYEFHHDLAEQRQDLREELARVRQEEHLKAREAILAEEREHVAQMKQCLPETAPLVESTIALPLQQKYIFGAPEVEVREMEELIKSQKQGLEERMSQWRREMAEFNERKRQHEVRERQRVAEELRNPTPKQRFTEQPPCGCQQAIACGHCCCAAEHRGHCGCDQALRCGRCCCRPPCDVTCEYAPLKEQPFTEKPPEMPREALLASELRLKVPVQIVQDVGEARVSRLRTSRVPVQEIPRQPVTDYPPRRPVQVPCDIPVPMATPQDVPVGPGKSGPGMSPLQAPAPVPGGEALYYRTDPGVPPVLTVPSSVAPQVNGAPTFNQLIRPVGWQSGGSTLRLPSTEPEESSGKGSDRQPAADKMLLADALKFTWSAPVQRAQ